MPSTRSSGRRSSSPTRFARAYTWQPDVQVERTVRRCRLPFSGDARDLIQRAAHLVAPLRPYRAMLCFFPAHHTPSLSLFCGADEHGVQTHVVVTLHPSDGGLLTDFVRDRSAMGTLFIDLPDDGDGEALSVPHISVDALARMSVPAMEA